MYINSWAQFPNHFHLTQNLEGVNQDWLKDEFGVRLLKLGDLSVQLEFETDSINYQFTAATKMSLLKREFSLCSSMSELPFDSEVFDAVMLAHVLEFSEHPHDVLREVHRVLNSNKCVIIHLLNPLSLIGLHSLWGRFSRRWRLYHEIKWIHPRRIRDWLLLLGFEIEQEQYSEFGWPRKVCLDANQQPFMEKVGANLWSTSGGIWSVKARKKDIPLTLDKVKWQKRKKLAETELAKPSFKQPHQNKERQ